MAHEDTAFGYLAIPEAAPGPGIVLVHDVWGLYDHFRDLAERLAKAGFATLAIDLYRNLGSVEITDPGAWMRGLSDPAILADIQEAVESLHARADVSPKVGVLGFCMGGTYALLAGCGLDRVAAVAPFYGILSHQHGLLYDEGGLDRDKKPREPLAAARSLECPLAAFYGTADPYVPLDDIHALEKVLAVTGQEVQVHLYPGAGHAFVNDTRPAAYRDADAKDAWAKLVAFFKTHLAAS